MLSRYLLLGLVGSRDSRTTKDRKMEDVKFDCHISSCIFISYWYHFISDSYDFLLAPFLISCFYHILCLQVFSHPQISLKTGQQGCQSHGRACHVHFCPSKAMAEAMDAADMPGLHSELLKLHRILGDDFNIIFDLLTR